VTLLKRVDNEGSRSLVLGSAVFHLSRKFHAFFKNPRSYAITPMEKRAFCWSGSLKTVQM
jgi:hypothetical protein